MPIDETLSPEIENPAESLLRAAAARLGIIEGNVHSAPASSVLPAFAPNFETGVNEDGEDVDLFVTEYDYTEGPNLTAGE